MRARLAELTQLVRAWTTRGAERIVGPHVLAVTVAVGQVEGAIAKSGVGKNLIAGGALFGCDAMASIKCDGVMRDANLALDARGSDAVLPILAGQIVADFGYIAG